MNALAFLINTFSTLYLACFLLRIVLQAVRADFYNPLSQFIVRVTDPLVRPARRLLPAMRGFDLPTFIVLVVLQLLFTALLLLIVGVEPRIDLVLGLGIVRLIYLTVRTYIFCIFVAAILTWFGQAGYSPIAMLLRQIVDPLLRPARRIIPPVGGIDLTPLIVIALLYAALILFNDTIAPLLVSRTTSVLLG